MNREKIIVRTGAIGIIANVLLVVFKAAVGWLSGSIAVILDAVNNLTDALSSVITIVSTKYAGKAPDKNHPYGHGRIEYLSGVSIAVIILYAGIASLTESVKKIIEPRTPDYTPVSLIIIGVAVAVKIVLGLYVRQTGRRVHSELLVASGKDALLDAVISASTLAAAFVFLIWHISVEAWLAAIISVYIIKTAIGMLRDSVSSILGRRTEGELPREIRRTILEFSEISGVYDLFLHNYGPGNHIGSVHIEVPGNMTAKQLDILERRITEKVYAETGAVLTGISVYAKSRIDPFSERVYADLRELASGYRHILQIHGFSADEAAKVIRFDIVIDLDEKNRGGIFEDIVARLKEKYPDYRICPVLDADAADF